MSFLTPTYLQRVKVTAMLAGLGSAMGAYWYTKTQVWNSTIDLSSALPGKPSSLVQALIQEQQQDLEDQLASSSSSSLEKKTQEQMLFDKEDRSRAAKSWNKAVDLTFGKFISLLSDKGL